MFNILCEKVCTAKMNLSDEVDLEDYVSRPDKISAAEVSFFKLLTNFIYRLHNWAICGGVFISRRLSAVI